MSEPPNMILDLPNVAMEEVLKNCDLTSGISLQRTCVSLRDFIDKVKPDFPLKMITIAAEESSKATLKLLIDPEPNSRDLTLDYIKDESNCVINSKWSMNPDSGKKVVEGEDPMTVCLEDFEALMRSRSFSLSTFWVRLPQEPAFPTRLLEILESKGPIRAENLWVTSLSQDQIFAVLRHVNPNVLRTIEIDTPRFQIVPMDINQLVDSPQWANVVKVKARYFQVSELPLESLSQLTRFKIRCSRFDRKELIGLKELFQAYTNAERSFKIVFPADLNLLQLISDTFGPSERLIGHLLTPDQYHWYFNIESNPQKRVQLKLRYSSIFLDYVGVRMRPRVAGIQD